jgi:hypothetical protein
MLARLQAAHDLIPIDMDVCVKKDAWGRELARECREKELEVEAAADKPNHMRERIMCHMQQPSQSP